MSPEHFKPDQFKKDLQRVLSLIRTSQRYLEDGKVVELAALETKVALQPMASTSASCVTTWLAV